MSAYCHRCIRVLSIFFLLSISYACMSRQERLRKAASNGDMAELWSAIEDGVNLDEKDDLGTTALMIGAHHGQIPVVELLLEEGADPALVDVNQRTALHFAAESGSAEIVTLLSKQEIAFSSRDAQGLTAADYAMSQGHSQLASYLENPFQEGDWVAQTEEGDEIRFTIEKGAFSGPLEVIYSFHLSNPFGDRVLFARCIAEGQPQPKETEDFGIIYAAWAVEDDGLYACNVLSAGGRLQSFASIDEGSFKALDASFKVLLPTQELLRKFRSELATKKIHSHISVGGEALVDGSISGFLEVGPSEYSEPKRLTWRAFGPNQGPEPDG